MGVKEKHTLPGYFRGKFQMIGTVTFTALFSLVLMLISIPFSDNAWFELKPSKAFAFTATFFAIALLVIIISRRVMYATRRMRMTYFGFVMWILAESLVVCLLYTAFTLQGDEIGIIDIEESSFLELLGKAMVYAFTSLIVPNIIAGMYFALLDKNKTIVKTRRAAAEPAAPLPWDRKINLYDLGGTLKFSASLGSIYYFESDDNYVIVWYRGADGELAKFMVRSRLKNLEENFKDTLLVRCNRKYVVNIGRVRVLRHGEQGYEIELDGDGMPTLPVTKTYEAQILKAVKDNGA